MPRRNPFTERFGTPSSGSEGLSEFWHRHARWVGAVLLAHRPGSSAELEDLLQEVALRAVRGLPGLRDEGARRAWLRTVALNVVRSAGRQAERRRAERSGYDEEVLGLPDRRSGAPRTDIADQLRCVLAAVRLLPLEYREVLLLKAVDGLSQRQIAEALQINENAVENRLARGRRWLRESLARDGVDVAAARTASGPRGE